MFVPILERGSVRRVQRFSTTTDFRRAERRRVFDEAIGKLNLPEPQRESLRPLALKMVERHREMFPHLHRS